MPEDQLPNINSPLEDKLASIQNDWTKSQFSGNGNSKGGDPTSTLLKKMNGVMSAKESYSTPDIVSPNIIDVSGRYPKQLVGWDNEDLYGDAQSGWSQAWRGIVKGVALAGTTFLQGTLGLVYGLGAAAGTLELNKLFNNDFSNAIDDFNKMLENQYLQNYYTKRERDAKWYEPANLFSTNFIFDKFVKNLGFSIGAIYSGAAVAKALRMIPAISSLFTGEKAAATLAQIESKLSTVPALQRTDEMYNMLIKASDAATKAAKFGSGVERTVIGTLGAVTEGGIEALQGLNEYRNSLIDNYIATNGVAPVGDELDKINDLSSSLGNSRFLLNIGLLSATNYIMLPKILGSSYKTSKSLANKEINNIVKNQEGKWVSALSQAPRVEKFIRKSTNVAELFFSPTEGFEELSQYAIERGVNDYYSKAYKGEGRSFANSMLAGYDQAINSNEGMEQFLIGALSGGMQQAGIVGTYQNEKGQTKVGIGKSGNIGERGITGTGGERGRNTTSFLAQMNDPKNQMRFKSDTWVKDMVDATARGINLQKEGEAFIRQGDVLEAKDNEADYMHNYLAVRIKHGRYDLVQDDIENFRQQAASPEGLNMLKQQGYANENDTQQTFLARVNNFEKHAKNIDSLYQSLNMVYGAKINQDGQRVYSDEVIDKMVYVGSKIADYEQRIPELSQQLLSNQIVLGDTLSNIYKNGVPSADAVKDAIKQIDDLSVIDSKKDELKQSLRDVIELTGRRKEFLDEFKKLKTSPESFTTVTEPTTTTATTDKKKIKLKTKDGEEELEVGTEYFAGSQVIESKEGVVYEKFPRFTIIGENEDGSVKIKTSNGDILDVKKDAFSKYKFGKVSDTEKHPNAMFYVEASDTIFTFNMGKKDKNPRGRLSYDPKTDKLYFITLDGKKTIAVTRDQFSPKKGYSIAQIYSSDKLTPKAEEALKQEVNLSEIQEKREARLKIISELREAAYDRLDKLTDKISQKKEQLEGVEKNLKELEEKLQKDDNFRKNGKGFKKAGKEVIRQLNILSGMRTLLSREIEELTAEQEEVEFNISYFEDMGQNIDELPTDSKDFIEELNNQVLDLQILYEETGKQINYLSGVLSKVEDALKTAVDFALNLIQKFEKKYPGLPIAPEALRSFLNKDLEFKGTWPDYQSYLTANPNLLSDLREFDRELADIDDLDVIPNERSVKELQDNIADLNKQLAQYEKEIKAKSAILDKFEDIAKEYKRKEEAKRQYEKDKALHDALFKAQSQLSEQPSDDSTDDELAKIETKDKEASKKKDLSIYPISTIAPSRETDPEFENKPHLLREEKFLNNYAAGLLKDENGNDITPDLRVLVIHRNNQAKYGLDGLVELRNPKQADESEEAYDKRLTNAESGTILYLYIKKGEGEWEVIDENGKKIGSFDNEFNPSGIDINKVVTSTAPAAKISLKAGSFTNKDNLNLAEVEKAWLEKRKQLLEEGDLLTVSGVSRGVKQVTSTSDKNPITPTLTDSKTVDKQQVIFVSTSDVINTPNDTIYYKAGRPYFQIGDNVILLNNRNINEKEADAIFLVLKEVATKFQESIKANRPNLDKQLVDWLNSIIYWYSPSEKNPTAHNHQIYVKSGKLFISGVDTGIYFNPDSLDANRKPIIETFLKGNTAGRGTYHHVSHKNLSSDQPYIEYYTEDGKTLKTREHKSYQHYLIANNVVSTNVRPQMSDTDSNIRGRYAITDMELSLPKEDVKPPKVEKKEEVVQSSGKPDKLAEALAVLAANKAKRQAKKEGAAAEEKEEKSIVPSKANRLKSTDTVSVSIKAADLLAKLNGKGFVGTDSNDEEYRRVVEKSIDNVKKEDIAAVKAWFAKNLPNVPLNIVEHILKTTDGGFAWGKFSSVGVTMYEKAKEGTGYHEAFEAVWKMFIPVEDKQKIVSEMRRRKGSFYDAITGQNTEYKSATDTQLKEKLADEFAEYVQTNGAISEKIKGQPWIIRIFRALKELFEKLVSPQNNIDQLFRNINSGQYATKPVNLESVVGDEYSRVADLSHQLTKELMEDITSKILNNFFGANATLSLANLSDNKEIPLDAYYDAIKPMLANKFVSIGKQALTEGDEELALNFLSIADNITDNWDDVVKLNKEYLKTFGLTSSHEQASDNLPEKVKEAKQAEFEDDNDGIQDDDEPEFEQENKSQLEYDRDIFTISGKKNASAGIRLLFATLRDAKFIRQSKDDVSVVPAIEFERSSLNGFKFVQYARVFNQVANALVNTNKMENLIKKLVNHAKTNAPIVDLLSPNKLNINRTTGKINYNSLSYNEWRILLDFVKTMSKQSPNALIYDMKGNTAKLIPGNKYSGIEQIKRNFVKNVKNNKELFSFDKKKKTFVVNPEFFKKNPTPTNDKAYIDFANSIGIKTVDGELLSLAMLKAMPLFQKAKFKSALSRVYTQLKKQDPLFDTSNKALQIETPLNEISIAIISATKDDGSNTFLNVLRKPVQSVVLNNPLSTFFNNFNSVSSLDNLQKEEQGLTDGFSKNSVILQRGGRFFNEDGDRTDEKIEVGYIDGIKTPRNSKQSSKLSLIQRRLLSFNLNLQGWFVPITNGDKKTEWILSLGNHISFNQVVAGTHWDSIYSIFHNYLKTEMEVAQVDDANTLAVLDKQKRRGNLRFFLNILPENITKKAKVVIDNLGDIDEFIEENEKNINSAIRKFLEKEASRTRTEFQIYNILAVDDNGNYIFDGIDEKFVMDNINDQGVNKFSEEQVDNVILYRTVNQVINNIEMHKLVIGDPAFMSDPAKRIPGAMGGVNQTTYGSHEFNTHFSALANRTDVNSSSIQLEPTDLGYTPFSDDVSIVIYQDVIVEGRVEGSDYKNTNEVDGGSKMNLSAYRELKIRSAEWTDEQEKQYQYQMAFFRDRMSKQGKYDYSSKELKEHDVNLLKQGQPQEGIFEIIKPKGWGQNTASPYKDIVFLKTSAQPIIPTVAKDTNDELLLLKMMNEGIKIAAFESAVKVGVRSTEAAYVDGKFNENKYNPDAILYPSWKDLGIQVETQFSQGKNKLTLGSQLTTLATLNLLSGGVPQGFTATEWSKLSEEERMAKSEIYREVVTNNQILVELTNNGYVELLDKLGIEEDEDGNYEIVDYQRVVDFLKEQARDMDDNTKAALKVDDVLNSLAVPLEAIPTYTQLKAILYSIVDKNIASPKTSGIGLVQMPSTFTENEARTTLVGNSTYKFYTKEEPWIEVSLPAWFRDHLERFYINNKKPIPSEEELLKLLNDTDILNGIGFRIPTQEMNSVEVFKIKSFLPKVMGNTIIVPSEITTKAGSDFDIDKLNAYLKNVIITKTGKISKVASFNSQEEAADHFGSEYENTIQKEINKIEKYEDFRETLLAVFNAIENIKGDITLDKIKKALNENLKEFYDVHMTLLNEIIDQAAEEQLNPSEYIQNQIDRLSRKKGKLNAKLFNELAKEMYIKKYTRKSLENAYYESLERLVQLPENFERLIQINTTKNLEEIKNNLNKALFTEDEIKQNNINTGEKLALNYLPIISPYTLDEIRHNLVTGKDGVGIAAAAQKSNSIMQRTQVVIDPSRVNLLDDIDPLRTQLIGDGVIRFPHNKINGKPTISMSKTADGKKYISDIISEYINGFVDVVKNTFIIEMGVTTRTAGTFLFMDRLGNNTEHTTYFMNQPIIRQYLKFLDKNKINGIRHKESIGEIYSTWGDVKYTGNDTLPTANQLLDNIKEYKGKNRDFKNLSPEFVEEQSKIFNEFLKYQEMASDLFTLMQGINWDTAHMSDPEQFLLKDINYDKANNTIFTPASEILKNVFIGNTRQKLMDSRNAIGGFIAIEHPNVREVLDTLKRKFISMSFFPKPDVYSAIAKRINNSFLNYILQVKGGYNRTQIEQVLLDEQNGAASLLEDLQIATKKDSVLHSILKQFSIERRGNDANSVKAIIFKKSGNDKYDRDTDIDNFRILKENAYTQELYKKLVRAALLQSGVQYSPISYSHLIPSEDYAKALSSLVNNLSTYTDLDKFLTSKSFARNNWSNSDVAKPLTISEKMKGVSDMGTVWAIPFILPKQLSKFPKGSIMKSRMFLGEYAKYQPLNSMGREMAFVPDLTYMINKKDAFEKNNPILTKTYLYEIVKDEMGKPLTITENYKNKQDEEVQSVSYLYKAINAWGDGMYAQEYYDAERSSQIENNTFKVDETVVNDTAIYTALRGKSVSLQSKKEIKTELIESSNKVIEGDIFSIKGIPVITTNLGGVHGAGLAQKAKSKGLIKQGDGLFKANNNVVQLPVKKIWSDNMAMNNNMKLLAESLNKLVKVANENKNNTYLLPLAGLGHGEGKVSEIMPLLISTLQASENIKLILPTEDISLGRQATVRKDETRKKLPEIKTMLEKAGFIKSNKINTSDNKSTQDKINDCLG